MNGAVLESLKVLETPPIVMKIRCNSKTLTELTLVSLGVCVQKFNNMFVKTESEEIEHFLCIVIRIH